MIVGGNLVSPSALAIDTAEDKLYWSDVGLKRIEMCDLSGKNRKVVLGTGLKKPLLLGVYGPYLYFLDRDQKVIERIDKITGANRQKVSKLQPDSSPVDQIEHIESMDTLGFNLCQVRNCGRVLESFGT